MSVKTDNKSPISSVSSALIGIILTVLIVAGLISLFEKMDQHLSTRIKNYAALKTFTVLLFEMVVNVVFIVFIGYYMYFLLEG